MKKITGIFAVMVCWILCMLPVRADLIWEPYDDNFYTKNRESCQYINRNYTADGPGNKVIVYKSPENPTVLETWENGHVAHIYYTWTDKSDTVWGMYNNWETDETGWVPMAYMDVVYDYICFEEEFGDSIVEETIAIPGEYAKKSIRGWSYPGAETCLEISMPDNEENMPQCSKGFVDEEGRKWGYIGYFQGIRNIWVCLDNPVADIDTLYPESLPLRGEQMSEESTLSEEETLSEENTLPDEEHISPSADGGTIGLVIGLVLGVCGATGGVLVWMKKKR